MNDKTRQSKAGFLKEVGSGDFGSTEGMGRPHRGSGIWVDAEGSGGEGPPRKGAARTHEHENLQLLPGTVVC